MNNINELVRLSGAEPRPRDGLAGGIAQTKMVRLSEAKTNPSDGLVGGIGQTKMVRAEFFELGKSYFLDFTIAD